MKYMGSKNRIAKEILPIILKNRKDGNGNILSFANNITEQKLLWPIPQTQRDNNSNLTQNPGY